MSNIPRARKLIGFVLDNKSLNPMDRKRLKLALRLMHRVKYCRRAPAKRQVIDRNIRRKVRRLADTTDMTMHEIANVVGLRSSGRISDVMHGKR